MLVMLGATRSMQANPRFSALCCFPLLLQRPAGVWRGLGCAEGGAQRHHSGPVGHRQPAGGCWLGADASACGSCVRCSHCRATLSNFLPRHPVMQVGGEFLSRFYTRGCGCLCCIKPKTYGRRLQSRQQTLRLRCCGRQDSAYFASVSPHSPQRMPAPPTSPVLCIAARWC